jgi:hypothetical protein
MITEMNAMSEQEVVSLGIKQWHEGNCMEAITAWWTWSKMTLCAHIFVCMFFSKKLAQSSNITEP